MQLNRSPQSHFKAVISLNPQGGRTRGGAGGASPHSRWECSDAEAPTPVLQMGKQRPGEGRPLGQSGACEELGLRPQSHLHLEPATLHQGTQTTHLPGKRLILLIAYYFTGVPSHVVAPGKALETNLEVPGSSSPPPLWWLSRSQSGTSREKADRHLPWAPPCEQGTFQAKMLAWSHGSERCPTPTPEYLQLPGRRPALCRAPPAGPSTPA